MPAATQPRYAVKSVLSILYESHEVPACESIERPPYTAEAAGSDTEGLLAMLHQGIALPKLLELIVSKAKCSQKAA